MTASDCVSVDEGVATSPKNKLKFLCSYGGKILARPGDANLKYIGGETRVVAVPRDINFSEIMKKLNSLVEGGDMILKYQVIPDELDALVTVKSDEDLKHMIDEYRRLESGGIPKLRAFLFPSSPIVIENHINSVDPHAVEQRYIEAVNGIVRTSSGSGRLTPNPAYSPQFSISACSSPKSPSPDGKSVDSSPREPPLLNANHSNSNRPKIPKVQSSPSLYSLGTQQNQSNHQVYQSPNYYYQQQVHQYSVQSAARPPQDFRMERFSGPHDFGLCAMGHGHGQINHIYSVARHNWGNGYCRCGGYEDSLSYGGANLARGGSVPESVRPERVGCPSPRNHIWE